FGLAGVRTLNVLTPDDPAIASLNAFACDNGFPDGWANQMLADGCQATLALDTATGVPLAMGWRTTSPFWVEEIGTPFDPQGAAYLFGDFVAPAHRGRGLQRLLVSHRLRQAPPVNCCTIIHPDNTASLRNYQHEGFRPTGAYQVFEWLGIRKARRRP
ncbi:MAG TPA: GNAT family N-acetyltransferase, partial [Tepidisphaeraceae bacterium]